MRSFLQLYYPVTLETKPTSNLHCGFSLMRPLIGLYSPETIETKSISNPHCSFFFNETSHWPIFSSNHRNRSHIQSMLFFSLMRPLIGLYSPVTIETKATSNPDCDFFLNEVSDWAIFSSNHRNKSRIQSTSSFFL